MTFRISTAARNASVDAVTALINAGTPPGLLRVRTSTQPTNVGDSENGTLLGTLTFSNTSFGASSTGTATANSITSDTNADASGTATHFRVLNAAATAIADGTCGLGSGDMSFDNNVIVAGGTIACTSFTITQPIS
jgi:hypothetical protein